jgi:hypothetical protein
MVVATGTAPLTSSDVLHPLYVKANNKLEVVNEAVQGTGWWFNTSKRTLNPNVAGEIILPDTTLHCDPVDTASKIIVRGTKLYDNENATYVIGKPVKVKFVDKWAVEELPPFAAACVKARAVYEFYRDEDGNEPKLSNYRQERDTAWVVLKGEHLKNADLNFFDGASAAQMARGYRGGRLPLSDA